MVNSSRLSGWGCTVAVLSEGRSLPPLPHQTKLGMGGGRPSPGFACNPANLRFFDRQDRLQYGCSKLPWLGNRGDLVFPYFAGKLGARPAGFEPATGGLEVRINLFTSVHRCSKTRIFKPIP